VRGEQGEEERGEVEGEGERFLGNGSGRIVVIRRKRPWDPFKAERCMALVANPHHSLPLVLVDRILDCVPEITMEIIIVNPRMKHVGGA